MRSLRELGLFGVPEDRAALIKAEPRWSARQA
jgi:hypothetical protein